MRDSEVIGCLHFPSFKKEGKVRHSAYLLDLLLSDFLSELDEEDDDLDSELFVLETGVADEACFLGTLAVSCFGAEDLSWRLDEAG